LPAQATKEVDVNSVVLTGNLATDVEVKEIGDERQVANFLLAVDRPGGDEADFFRVSAWNKQAEVCGRYLSKGRRIGVDGRLRSSSWEDAEGNKRNAVEVVAHHVEFLSPPPGSETSAAEVPFETAAA
jgi:single-strand DNA-binding protein